MTEPDCKVFRLGTHRAATPEQSFRRALPFLAEMGITRIANVTGLDRIGLPTFAVARPNARSLSVFQGKGATSAAAKISGVMEAVECFHAEHITLQRIRASRRDMLRTCSVVAVSRLPRFDGPAPDEAEPIEWVRGFDILNAEAIMVPFDAVHLDLRGTPDRTAGWFPISSNGLASGNTYVEAVIHGICEVIERDATLLWQVLISLGKPGRRLDLNSVTDAVNSDIINRIAVAGCELGVWDTTTDIGIPGFYALLVDRPDGRHATLYGASGKGCHPSPEVALSRAILEAAQSRVTAISAAREDISRATYADAASPAQIAHDRVLLDGGRGMVSYSSIEDLASDSLARDLEILLCRLRAAGIDQVAVVNLTRARIGLPVVKVVIPGLEGPELSDNLVIGPRARALLEEAELSDAH
jgi:YcaO-like protein with predicted kinase domain